MNNNGIKKVVKKVGNGLSNGKLPVDLKTKQGFTEQGTTPRFVFSTPLVESRNSMPKSNQIDEIDVKGTIDLFYLIGDTIGYRYTDEEKEAFYKLVENPNLQKFIEKQENFYYFFSLINEINQKTNKGSIEPTFKLLNELFSNPLFSKFSKYPQFKDVLFGLTGKDIEYLNSILSAQNSEFFTNPKFWKLLLETKKSYLSFDIIDKLLSNKNFSKYLGFDTLLKFSGAPTTQISVYLLFDSILDSKTAKVLFSDKSNLDKFFRLIKKIGVTKLSTKSIRESLTNILSNPDFFKYKEAWGILLEIPDKCTVGVRSTLYFALKSFDTLLSNANDFFQDKELVNGFLFAINLRERLEEIDARLSYVVGGTVLEISDSVISNYDLAKEFFKDKSSINNLISLAKGINEIKITLLNPSFADDSFDTRRTAIIPSLNTLFSNNPELAKTFFKDKKNIENFLFLLEEVKQKFVQGTYDTSWMFPFKRTFAELKVSPDFFKSEKNIKSILKTIQQYLKKIR